MESPIRRTKESKKNKFVPDMNNMEHVIAQLKGKLKVLTSEMKDAVERMNSMTVEMNTIKNENLINKDRLTELEQENALLISQIEEMANERAERDIIIEEFGSAVEGRLVEWKEILDEKDSVIAKLKENLLSATTDRLNNVSTDEKSHVEIDRLIQDIDRRDEIIAELQAKLAEAVIEINESSQLIEKFKSDGKTKNTSKRTSKDQQELNKKIQDATKRLSTLESLLERAEKDAKVKSQQLCETLAILNKYEDENTSLSEAFGEIKALKDQMHKKNKHIEDLVDVVNRLENENSRFEEAIIVLREKLGLTEEDSSCIDDLILQRQQAQEDKVTEMQRNYDQLSSENVDLKFQIRQLKTALRESLKHKLSKTNGISSDGEHIEELSHRSESKKEHVELRRIKENVKWIIEENEALRQGMHEILDSIHNQDGRSMISIQSKTLENLLEALDARHVAGWYQPAMRLQGRVNYLQGSNAELREQLQQIRKNQLLFQSEMQQRASSVEEGECSQPRHSPGNISPDMKVSPSYSRNLTPKSITSVHSQTADSGRASGKPADMDEIQRIGTIEDEDRSESIGSSPLEDEGFGKKSEELYAMAKEIVAQESDYKKLLNDAEKQRELLANQVVALRKTLASFVSSQVYNELKGKYLETNMRLRAAVEDKLTVIDNTDEAKDIEVVKSKAMQDLRNELISIHKQLSETAIRSTFNENQIDSKAAIELETSIAELKAENERLKKEAEIAHEEALIHRAIDSTVLAEINELRQRILKFEMNEDQEIKEATRLSLELANYKIIETGLREQKKVLEREVARMRKELDDVRMNDKEIAGIACQQGDCRRYIEIIDFLQHQYAGSTSLSAWERYEIKLNKLNNDRNEVKELILKINEQNENVKIQHETLTSRLQIVEELKNMLEQQIGSGDVQDIMQKFSSATRQTLMESKCHLQINQLEEKVHRANIDIADYETKLMSMEKEMSRLQKAWKVQKLSGTKRPACVDKVIETDKMSEVKTSSRPAVTKSTQTEIKIRSIETQCVICCKLVAKNKDEVEQIDEECETDVVIQDDDGDLSKASNVALLQEQLGQALSLATERSVALSKCESQIAEYRAKIAALTRLLEEKASNSLAGHHSDEATKDEESGTRQEALQLTIKSLQKIISQRDETIARYQALLKDDRDKHSAAASRLHDEIKSLRNQIIAKRPMAFTTDNALSAISEQPERDLSLGEAVKSEEKVVEEMSVLREKICRLETELSISHELAERWHRLAEDRLRHMDSTRQRLEEQHNEEIDSYRKELNKRQREVDELRRLLSENRRAPSSEVMSIMKALQIEDNRLADEIESELEERAAITSQQLSSTYRVEESRTYELEQLHSQVDNLRKQLHGASDRERSYKSEIAGLKQEISKRYMAVKAQEKKASRRETYLEKKVKELEEELHETKELLGRHYVAQQAKRAKTAEDLGLWEKLKKWQQTAERLKEKLKEKSDECQRLQNNYEKLRSLIVCMEREKWYLRGKFRSESVPIPAWTPSTEATQNNDALVEELQRECQELRDRVRELVARLNSQDNAKNEEKKRPASVAFEA
ncbi:centrosomal protein cep290-like isoform X2 [Phymastichus coffea]|uniref:centrosomal protein cep290-like isoform X2 n=1 Tax=Phymastichus coffea TaxID=108790 RepID=UPI00273B0F33|nr:centrosomal protein cep290-like isoform X2 [Phymastichus coffea]